MITSGTIPGCGHPTLPHHLDASTLEEARKICEYWVDDAANPRQSSRRGELRAGKNIPEKVSFSLAFLCIGFWAVFVAWYLATRRTTQCYSNDQPWTYGALWYILAVGPTLCKCTLKLALRLHNIELWDAIQTPIQPGSNNSPAQPSLVKTPATVHQASNRRPNFAPTSQFSVNKSRLGFHTRSRIAYLQLTQTSKLSCTSTTRRACLASSGDQLLLSNRPVGAVESVSWCCSYELYGAGRRLVNGHTG
jgi:hypothetical protein